MQFNVIAKYKTIAIFITAALVGALAVPSARATTVYSNPSASGSAFCGGGTTENLGFVDVLPGNAVTAFTFASAGSQFGGGVASFAIFSDPSYSNPVQTGSLGFFNFGFPNGSLANYSVFVSGFLPSGYWQISLGALCTPVVSTVGYTGLTIDQEPAPPGITSLGQSVGGTTPIPPGGVTTATTVTLSASIQPSASADPLQFQIELEPSATAFSGNPTAVAASSAGQLVTTRITNLSNGSYHWAARVFDPVTHAATPWQPFSGGTSDFVVADALVQTSASVLTDPTTTYSAGNGFVGGCCANFIMTPGPVFYQAPARFVIQSIVVDDTDLSLNNHDGVGNIRAQIHDLAGNSIATSTNTIYGESGCTGCAFQFQNETVPQNFQLSLVVEDGIQGDGFFTLKNLRFVGVIQPTSPAPQISDVSLSVIFQGESNATLAITGTNFQPGSIVLTNNPGITIVPQGQATATEIVVSISIAADARPGATDITVTNPDGQTSTAAGALTVKAVLPPSQAGLGSPTQNGQQQAVVAEPVSTATGNYYYQHTDFVVPGRGLPLVFERTYNSLDSYVGPLGANWTDSYNVILTPSLETVTIKWGDGHSEVFTASGSGYLPQPGVHSILTKNADGSFFLLKKDQTGYEFSTSGQLTAILDKNGNTTTLTYDLLRNLTRVTDAAGRSLALAYDLANRLISVTDLLGRTELFQYDSADNLVASTDPAGGVTTFVYDAAHRVLSITLPNGQILLQNAYDVSGRVVRQANGAGHTWTFLYGFPNASDTSVTDALGNTSIYSYDSLARIAQVKDALNGNRKFTYDLDNNRTSVADQNGNVTKFTYDAQGNVTTITYPFGNTSAFTYDQASHLRQATDSKGNVSSFAYDPRGNLISMNDALGNTTAFAFDGLGQLTSRTDARGSVTAYGYDANGNLAKVTDALGHNTLLGYDAVGRLTSLTDANGNTASATYDVLSRLIEVSDPLGDQTHLTYDTVGNLTKITDADGNATSYGYDAVNNLASVTDALGHVTEYGYDADNNRTSFTNAKGNTTTYSFDALNRLIAVTDPLLFVTTYSYDPAGNLVALKDANGTTNQFAYDVLNRLARISYGDGQVITYSYDANGNRIAMTDGHGTTSYQYDALNRVNSVTSPDGKTVGYQYDALGNRQSVTYPDGKTVSYSHDPANRLLQVLDWLGRSTAYSYDAAGNLVSLAYPNHSGISFAYDAANRLINVTNTIQKPGSDDATAHHFGTFQYLLDAVGNRLQVSNGTGKIIRYSYDQLYELTGVNTVSSGDAQDDEDDPELVAGYVYDSVGNRVQQITPAATLNYAYDADDRLLTAGTSAFTYDANGNRTSAANSGSSLPVLYGYDAANRLTSVTSGLVSNSFSYDGDGNRLAQSVTAGTYNYVNDTAAGLPVVLQESGPDGNISYSYGLRLISESSSAFDFFYQYDGLGSVVGLTNANGNIKQRYVYDAWGDTLHIMGSHGIGTENKFRFTGEAQDPGTELYYLRARYYDAEIGRLITKDTAVNNLMFSRTFNSYEYVLNNPVAFVDPTGHSPLSALSSVFIKLPAISNLITDFSQALDNANLQNQCFSNIDICSNPGAVEHNSNRSIARLAVDLGVQGTETVVATSFSPTVNGFEIPSDLQGMLDFFHLPTLVDSLISFAKQAFSIPTAHAAAK